MVRPWPPASEAQTFMRDAQILGDVCAEKRGGRAEFPDAVEISMDEK